jgi:hypothetical protein
MKRLLTLVAATLLAGMTMLASPGTASAQGVQLFSSLLGGNVIDTATGKARAGDLDGNGAAALVFGKLSTTAGQLCYGITVNAIDKPIAAHLHRGPAGINGGIIATFVPPVPPGGGSPGASSGCVVLAIGILNAIRAVPSEFYIDVHTAIFKNGALRGQLF